MITLQTLRSLKSQIASLLRDEAGGETIESVLIVGMIVAVCITAINVFGDTLNRKWNDVLNSL